MPNGYKAFRSCCKKGRYPDTVAAAKLGVLDYVIYNEVESVLGIRIETQNQRRCLGPCEKFSNPFGMRLDEVDPQCRLV